jgi:hypothetical protein
MRYLCLMLVSCGTIGTVKADASPPEAAPSASEQIAVTVPDSGDWTWGSMPPPYEGQGPSSGHHAE